MKKTKVILGVSISLAVLIVAIVIAAFYMMNKYVPDYNDKIQVTGISNEVKVYRDSAAVVYIVAEKELDAAFALGFVHAQERMFQMDMLRRAGEGRLSEIIGTRTLFYDKMFRTLGLYKTCQKHYNQMSDVTKKNLEAYSKGVNAYLKEAEGRVSVEFDVLGYDPYLWKPEHSLLISKLMAWALNIGWWSDISYAHLLQKLDPELIKQIIPDYEENAPLIIPTDYKKEKLMSMDFLKLNREARDFFNFTGTHIGSNNWVVNSKKSLSGKPLIANDPHLALQSPATWVVAVIKSDNWNVSGFTMPGAPGVVIGKNDNISWVLTNVMADDCDLYIEEFNDDNTKYKLDGRWKDLVIEKDTISVKDSSDVIFGIKKTHRGPVISDIHPYYDHYENDYQTANISMRWTAYEFSDEIYGLIKVNKASNWQEFKEGVKDFTAPGQNFVYADNEDNIGYICAARLPIRVNVSPTIVYDGRTSIYDWKGFVPYEEMPMMLNPKENYIASANNKTIKNYKYHISNTWEPPSRIKRIIELLEEKEKLGTDDYKQIQNDFFSHYAKFVTPYILNAFSNYEIKDENLKLAIELLSKWDYVYQKDGQPPAIFAVFYQELLSNIFEDEMGEELFKEYILLANVPYRMVKQLLANSRSIWFDDVTTEKQELRDEIIRRSMGDALNYLEKELGTNVAEWQWGRLHNVTFKHPFSGVSSLLDRVVNTGPFPIGGDGTTVFNTEYSFTAPYSNELGPSMRFIYDFDSPDVFEFILTTGQSGHIASDHYNDMTDKWINGEYIKVNTDRKNILSSDMELLLLTR